MSTERRSERRIKPEDWEKILRTRKFSAQGLMNFAAMMAIEIRRMSEFLQDDSEYVPAFRISRLASFFADADRQ